MIEIYKAPGTILIILIVTPLILLTGNFTFLQNTTIASVAIATLTYAIRRSLIKEENRRSMIQLLGGHYLLLFAYGLKWSAPQWATLILWTIMTVSTIGYDFLGVAERRYRTANQLISMMFYCIMWGVAFYFVQNLIINGVGIEENKITIIIQVSIGLLGGIYVFLGLLRLYYTDI